MKFLLKEGDKNTPAQTKITQNNLLVVHILELQHTKCIIH